MLRACEPKVRALEGGPKTIMNSLSGSLFIIGRRSLEWVAGVQPSFEDGASHGRRLSIVGGREAWTRPGSHVADRAADIQAICLACIQTITKQSNHPLVLAVQADG